MYAILFRMNNQKLTPKDRKVIVARVKTGELQKDLAVEYDVSEGLISRVVKRAKSQEPENTGVSLKDMGSYSTEQLQNRRQACYQELRAIHDEIDGNLHQVADVQKLINEDTERLNATKDDAYRKSLQAGITAKRTQLMYLKDTKRQAFRLAVLHQELSAILHEISKRPDGWIPIGHTYKSAFGATVRSGQPHKQRLEN